MQFIALTSGGKDSMMSIIKSLKQGNKLVCIANLKPASRSETDSYMYQSVGQELVSCIADCVGVPLVQCDMVRKPVETDSMEYNYNPEDEVEDLQDLLHECKLKQPQVQAVSSGAILSNQQRKRVENVCKRLNLVSIAPLWERNETQLFKEYCEYNSDYDFDFRITKTCAMGLDKDQIMRKFSDVSYRLEKIKDISLVGEGGEFETSVFDCEFMMMRIDVDDTMTQDVVTHDAKNDVQYASFDTTHIELVNKFDGDKQKNIEKYQEQCIRNNQNILFKQDVWNILFDKKQSFEIKKYKDQFKGYLKLELFWEQDLNTQFKYFFEQLVSNLHTNEIDPNNVYKTNFIINDMSQFSDINREQIKTFNKPCPPARATVSQQNNYIFLQFEGWIGKINNISFHNLHVESMSEWIPANIGPQSQASKINDALYIAGIVPLNPQNLEVLYKTDFDNQYKTIIRQINEIISKFKFQKHQHSQVYKLYYDISINRIDNLQIDKDNLIDMFIECRSLPKGVLVKIESIHLDTETSNLVKFGNERFSGSQQLMDCDNYEYIQCKIKSEELKGIQEGLNCLIQVLKLENKFYQLEMQSETGDEIFQWKGINEDCQQLIQQGSVKFIDFNQMMLIRINLN